MTYPILGVSGQAPRKGFEGFAWFKRDVPKEVRTAIQRDVPPALRSALDWQTLSVLRVGTADDVHAWIPKLGSWDALVDVLLRFLARADARAPLAFFISSASSERDVPLLESTVFPRLQRWFDAVPVNQSTSGDIGSWVSYWSFGSLGRWLKQHRGDRVPKAWLAMLRASLGRSFDHDLHRILSLGPVPKDWASKESDPRMILPVVHKMSRRPRSGAMLQRVVIDGTVNADWVDGALQHLAGGLMSGSGIYLPRTSADTKDLACLLDAAKRAFDLGASDRLPWSVMRLANALGEWELEVSAVRRLLAAAEPGPGAIECAESVMTRAKERGDTRALEEIAQLLQGPSATSTSPRRRGG